MTIKRDIIDKIIPFLKREEFISIIGPRQSGKTTLFGIISDYLSTDLKIGMDHIKYITFEDRKLILEFEKDTIAFMVGFDRSTWITFLNPKRTFFINLKSKSISQWFRNKRNLF